MLDRDRAHKRRVGFLGTDSRLASVAFEDWVASSRLTESLLDSHGVGVLLGWLGLDDLSLRLVRLGLVVGELEAFCVVFRESSFGDA